MHVLDRPHLPRLIRVSIATAIVAIAISLVLASSLSNINQQGNDTGPAVRETAPASTLQMTAPRWATNPFASLLSRPLPQPWAAFR